MSRQAEPVDQPVKAGEAIDGFHELYPRQIAGHEYRVLSLRNDGNTAHRVDTEELSCTCRDAEYNVEEPEVCDHLAIALYQAPSRISVEDTAPFYLSEAVDRAQEAAELAEDAAEGMEDGLVRTRENQAAAVSQEDPEPVQEEPVSGVDVEEVEDFLSTGFSSPELVDVRSGDHDMEAGVVLQPDNQSMADHVYESFKGIVNAIDGSTVHVGFGDEPCNTCGKTDGEFWYHIPADTEDDVFA